ncbi:MAG: hypothetical protein IT328_20190 [Caldilineaceae bacterium]|nr:hypothetical protein [Caldilineaceae bacterium]
MTHPFQWQLYIGPAWHPSSSPYHTSWSFLSAGGVTNLDYSTTLASTLSSGATSALLVNAASFPSQGGAWVGPNGSGQAWEYVEYSGKATNTLTGLARESTTDREHNGAHNAGAIIRPWWKVTSDDGRMRYEEALDQLFIANEWQFQVSGVAAPQAALRPFHLAVVQSRSAVTGSLSTLCVGFLDASTIRDDSTRVRSWSARIVSLAGLLKRLRAEGVRVGDFDAVVHGTAQSSTPLAAAHKERWSGDFVAASPGFEADGVLEEDGDAIWIGDRMIGTTETVDTLYDGFTQVYINPPASVNSGTRWIEFANRSTASIVLVAWNRDTGTEVALNIPSEDLGDGERMIIAENEARFVAENPSQQAARIFDVSGSSGAGWFNQLKVQGGAIAFKFMGNYLYALYWGDVTQATTGWAPDGFTGASLAAPGPGETLRFKMLDHGHPNTKDNWEVGRNQSPGYMIRNNAEDAWIAIELPGMGLVLRDDITNVAPGAGSTLYIDGQNGPSTDGLPSSGTLVIGDERISYSAKVAGGVTVSARGVGGTTAASHKGGDAIFLVFSQGGRTMITDGLPLGALIWERSGGTIYPRDFIWRYSALPARLPSDEQHEDDYEIYNTNLGHASSSHTQGLSNNRARTILLEFQKMTVDPARPRVNRIKAIVDPAFYDSSKWLSSGQSIETVMQKVATNAGIPAAVIFATDGAAPEGFTTAIDSAWAVMTSAAELGGSAIRVARDSKLLIAPDTFWTAGIGSYTPVKTWTRSNAANVELIRNGGGAVSQVKLTWKTPDGSGGGVAVWPATAGELGEVQEIGPLYFATEAGATLAARKRYYLTRYPHELAVTLAAGDLTVAARQVHLVQWQLADDMQVIDRLMLVTQVQHYVEKQTLGTTLYGVIIDRESDG